MPDSYLDQPVAAFIDSLAAPTPAPAGGSAAALVVAQSAALAAMAARLSARQLAADRVEHLFSEGEKIARAAASLIDTDAQAYQQVIEAYRVARAAAPDATPTTAPAIAEALARAADVPMRLVELAAASARLGRELAAEGNQALRGDAITACLLAEAGGRAAAALVRINLAAVPADPRLARLEELLAEIAELDVQGLDAQGTAG